jgi:hypothetical protein
VRELAPRPILGIAAAALTALSCLTQCSGEEGCSGAACAMGGVPTFGGKNGSGGASGGSTNAGGTTNSGGVNGGSVAGGADGGAGAEAGAAGGPDANNCDECAPYEFCRKGTCVACSDTLGAAFQSPQKLGISGRYPRPTVDGGLFYVAMNAVFFAAPNAGPATAITDGIAGKDSAPLYVEGFDALVPNRNFFFLRTDDTGSSLRGGYFLNSSTPSLTKIGDAPLLFASMDGFNYSLAISLAAARAYWRTTRSESPGMVTAALASDGSDITALDVQVAVGARACPADEADPTAWVTPDGALLLFRQSIVDERCEHPLGFSTDLFALPLDPATGVSLGPATSLGVLPGGNARDSDPAFGADCSLYFSSDADGNGYELYRAERMR